MRERERERESTRVGEHLATACLPLNQGVIQGVWGGHEEVWGWNGEGNSSGW